jgi:purine-nucleoside phosphorylase
MDTFGKADDELMALPLAWRSDLFKDQVVMVSGAGRGIGKAIAVQFARLGAKLAIAGRNADTLGERFPDMTDAWSPRLRRRLHAAAGAEAVDLREGVYIGLTGPTYETPAEVRMLAGLGGHAVGMSTVLECIAARWVGLEVCGVSLVTNAGAGYTGEPLTHEEVLASGVEAGPRLARVIRRFLADLADD